MTRYWRDAHGIVHSADDTFMAPEWVEEVRVVPIDAIVVERSELPEVEVGPGGYIALPSGQGFGCNETPEWYRERAIDFLTAGEHVKANPPVDEAQVKVFAQIMREALSTSDDPKPFVAEDAARRLLATGRIEVKS